MKKFNANLSMLFTEVPFLERFAKAKQAGFDAVEYLFPYDFAVSDIKKQLNEHDLKQVLFNFYPGEFSQGERGIAALPGREDEFKASVQQAIEYANTLNCKKLHVMAGVKNPNYTYEEHEKVFVNNMRYAADAVAPYGITLLIEPLNSRDVPNYFVSHQNDAIELIKLIDKSNIRLQFDVYHAQIMDGDLTKSIESHANFIGHVQIASVPHRNEPNLGEVNIPFVLKVLRSNGYLDYIGCEYNPIADTQSGLVWLDNISE